MSKALKVWGGVAAVTLLLGLIVGFWPLTEDVGNSTGVHCGSAFAPDSAPTGTNDAQVWGRILGYQASGPFVDTPDELRDYCSIFLGTQRGKALTLVIPGALGLLAIGLGVQRTKRVAARDRATAEAEREAQWRAAGWVPPTEAPVPPRGWVRVEPASEAFEQSGAPVPGGYQVGLEQP